MSDLQFTIDQLAAELEAANQRADRNAAALDAAEADRRILIDAVVQFAVADCALDEMLGDAAATGGHAYEKQVHDMWDAACERLVTMAGLLPEPAQAAC